ncbi:MAG: glycoside hydrolase family 13 protein [Bacteroidia bacterium]|nr:glycoside hydrolase family 13 protein [Bacteroidia bacterium]
MLRTNLLLWAFTVIIFGCNTHTPSNNTDSNTFPVPEWAKEVVWYQIFPERFRNGDPTNDPTPHDIEQGMVDPVPADWKITPWGWDWYKADPWFSALDEHGWGQQFKIQYRRYGGDLQGVMDQLDYLQELGVTAIFFNPLNDASSLHKYDARNYHHIDRNFGPRPRQDEALIAKENPADPSTWTFTAADSLFVELVKELHRREMRVIMDYSWNHTGRDFWALDDVRKNGENSQYKDWYEIFSYDDPNTPEDEFKYKGWFGSPFLAEAKKAIIGQDTMFPFEGNLHSQAFKQHVYDVSARWLDPNGDGDRSDGVDGFRLDVAAEIPLGFWVEYREEVRKINPEAYLVGEVWWQKFPDDLMDPRPFVQGDIFDAIMNYRWYRAARQFFGHPVNPLTATGLKAALTELNDNVPEGSLYAMMNMSASHDAPRLATSLFNSNKYKYQAKATDDPGYKIHKPDAHTRALQKLLLIHQFTFIGAPQIWNGDEMGMWGADDPDCRKPLIWPDLAFDDETVHPLPDGTRPVDAVKADTSLIAFYRKLITLRKNNPVLIHGDISYNLADDEKQLFGYKRSYEGKDIYILFNRSEQEQVIPEGTIPAGTYRDLLTGDAINSSETLTMSALSARVLEL